MHGCSLVEMDFNINLNQKIMKKSVLLIAVLAIGVAVTSCKKDAEPCFNVSSDAIDDGNNPIVGEKITFENCSENADSYLWDFDDGESSASVSPKYSYEEGGEYTVTLEATNKKGTVALTQNIEVLSLSGEWECISNFDTDTYNETLDVEQVGSDLEGDLEGVDLINSNVDEYDIEFSVFYSSTDGSMTWIYTGEINDDYDEMEGTYKVLMNGSTYTDASFTWSAEKTKSKSGKIESRDGAETTAAKFKALTR